MKQAEQNLINSIRLAIEEEQREAREQEMKKLIIELGNNAHKMTYSELKKIGFMAKAVVDMIVIEVKDDEKSLDLLERFIKDEITSGEVEKIIQGE